MGIFSDEDINDADELIKKSQDAPRRVIFLEAFEEGWKVVKDSREVEGYVIREKRFPPQIVGGYFENVAKTFKYGVRLDFLGEYLGTFVALIRYHPMALLYNTEELIAMVKALEEKRPDYFELIISRMREWARKIKPSDLPRYLEPNYYKLLRGIGLA